MPSGGTSNLSRVTRPRRERIFEGLRNAAIVVLAAMLALSVYGTLVPANPRCEAPGAVGCPGGLLGPAAVPAGSGNQWFDVTMDDWGFFVVDTTTGANDSGTWNVFEGWTVHVNATSLPPDAAIGGEAYHGLGIEINATGQQLMSLAAPVGQWVSASFVAPTTAYYHQHIWCTIQCGPGHSSQQEHILNIIPAVPMPIATASANATLGPAPFSVQLSGNVTSGTAPYNLTWSFGDGTPPTYGSTAQHTYLLGGIYYATITATDAKGNQGQASVTITVLSSAPLTATLTSTPSSGLAPLGTSFSTVAHGGTPPYTYSWAYGDGSTGVGPNSTTHVFNAPGIYATSVDVTDAAGSHERAITSVIVRPSAGSIPVSINATPPNGTTPLSTTLAASASGGSAPYNYSWILGDGATGKGATVTHLYNQTGAYQATVFVADAAGKTGIGTILVSVNSPSNGSGGGGGDDGPTSAASSNASPAASNLSVRLVTTPSGGSPPLVVETIASIQNGTGLGENVTWNFGDGGSGTGQVATHTFSNTGSFDVIASVSDSGGNTGTASTTVHVGGAALSIAVNRTAGDSPVSLTAAATLTGGSGTWGPVSWSWGDGSSAVGYLETHTYGQNLSGNYTIGATATDSMGLSVNGSVTLVLTGPPIASLSVQLPSSSGLPASVTFTLKVTGGSGGYPTQALWSFGDLTSTRGPAVETHSYNRTGHYRVTVETNDSAGRVALASTWVNLSSAFVLPHLGKGQTVWVFTGVPNPETASLVMIGLVGATGLAFLFRKGRKRAAAKAGTSRPAPAPTASKGNPGRPPTPPLA